MPSCRHNNFPKRFDGFDFSDEESDSEDKCGNSAKVQPEFSAKNMANYFGTEGPMRYRRAVIPGLPSKNADCVPPLVVNSANLSSRPVYY